MTQPKVTLIVGAARSGTTLAGLMLAQSGHFAFAGELSQFWGRGLEHNHLCGCGERIQSCPFWSDVIATCGFSPANAAGQTDRLRRALASTYSINPLTRMRSGAVAERDVTDLKKDITNLYSAIHEKTGGARILDTSKEPVYARLLIDTLGPENVQIILLVRDPRGVVYSNGKKKAKIDTGRKGDLMQRRGTIRASLNWLKTDYSARLLKRTRAAVFTHRYEDMCADAPSFVRNMLIEMRLNDTPSVLSDGALTHTISGNPIRMNGVPKQITVDEAWRCEMPFWRKALVTLICAGPIWRYGYGRARAGTAPRDR